MNGFITKVMVGGSFLVASVLVVGCQHGPWRADPCWPERYNAVSRTAVKQPTLTQAANGHILDQTIWNWMFTTNEKGKQELNEDGRKHLIYLLRRRPSPDPRIFLQTAHDIPYNPENPDQFAAKRTTVDSERMQIVQEFLTAQSAGRQMAVPFSIIVHDPAPVDTTHRQAIRVMAARSQLFQTPTKGYFLNPSNFGGGSGGGFGGGFGGGTTGGTSGGSTGGASTGGGTGTTTR